MFNLSPASRGLPSGGVRVAYVWNAPVLDWLSTGNNPYAGLLAAALSRLGVKLQPQEDTGLAFIWRLRRTHRVLHLNWIVRLYQHRRPLAAVARPAAFAFWLGLARVLGYRIVFTMHNLLPHEQIHPRFDRLARRLVMALAHAVICHCDVARRQLAQAFGRRRAVYVVPHGSFRDAYPHDAHSAEARRALDLSADAFVYGYFGTFRALPDPDARLLIAGQPHPYYQGPLGSQPIDDHRVQAHFRFIANEKIQIIMAAADVIVLPFHSALTSGSAILALGHGKPLVMPAVGCLPELAGSGPCAILYDQDDPDGLLRALRQGRELDLGAARQAALEVDACLDWDSIARLTLQAYGLPMPVAGGPDAPMLRTSPGSD